MRSDSSPKVRLVKTRFGWIKLSVSSHKRTVIVSQISETGNFRNVVAYLYPEDLVLLSAALSDLAQEVRDE